MKKIALTLVAVSALGLAACQGNSAANNTVTNETDATNAAASDLGNPPPTRTSCPPPRSPTRPPTSPPRPAPWPPRDAAAEIDLPECRPRFSGTA